MKIKHFLLIGVASIIALSACSKNENFDNRENQAAIGYLQISIDSQQSRTEGSKREPNFDTNDSKISSLHLLLINPANGIITQIIDAGIINAGVSNPVQAPVGSHNLYVLVNASGNILNNITVDVTKINEAIATISGSSDINTNYANTTTGFLMVSANDNNKYYGSDDADSYINISANNTATNPLNTNVKVDRVVAGIRAQANATEISITGVDDDQFTPIIDEVVFNGFVLLNGQANTNLVQNWITSADATTPAPTNAKLLMALSSADYYSKAGQIASYVNGVAVAQQPGITFGTKAYTLENRSEILEGNSANDNVTTGVIFKITAKKAGSSIGTFYRVKNNGKCFTNKTDALAEINSIIDIELTDTTPVEDLRKNGLMVYENGEMYYTFFIKDQNYKYKDALYYAIHRNSIYDLTVNSISKFGSDVPGGDIIDPENPNPIDGSYIQVSITVNQWILNTIGVDL